MTFLIYALVYIGSAVMVYNIWRYHDFMRKLQAVDERGQMRKLVVVPFALLIAFLVGYLVVGLLGEPDLVIAGILFGGSLFVAIVLEVIYRIIGQLRENNARAAARYGLAKADFENLAKNHLSAFRVNLTRDVIYESSGAMLDAEDRSATSFTELQHLRHRRRVAGANSGVEPGRFTREALIDQFQAGNTLVEERVLLRLMDGRIEFVNIQAMLVDEPGTGDVLAFVVETLGSGEMVNEVLLEKVLAEQYDMITFLVDGRYGVVIGEDAADKPGSVFPHEKNGDYMEYLTEYVAPVIVGTPEEKIALMSSLGINRIESELACHEPYEVNIACDVDGQVFYKRFVYYTVDADAHFYLLLKSDTTKLRREEIERSRILEGALDEARRANEAKTSFLSNISHDIRTPMNAIVGYTEFARKSNDVAQIHDYLGKIDASGKYLLALINDVLEMSRIESGKMELEFEPVDLADVLRDIQEMFGTQMAEEGIAFTAEAPQLCNSRVLCDKTRLYRVLLNLLSNAHKFTPEGGSVSLVVEQMGPPVEGVAEYELRVKDTGIGMSPEFTKHVFDAFERERSATASGIQGTGLGMAITKRIVDAMGGTIEVASTPGQGTEFDVRLRLPLQDPDESGCSEPPETPDKGLAAGFAGRRVLLAEDNEINREIAGMILGDMGLEVDMAEDGQVALGMLENAGQRRYDIVITDIQMPVLDGFGLAQGIRASSVDWMARIPIVAMSANAFAEDIRTAREAGIDGYVAKPIDTAQLASVIAQVLEA